MRRILICTGVLGGGTAITFTAAALVATMFPTGNLLYGQQHVVFDRGFNGGGIVMPAPVPQPGILLENVGGAPDAKGG